MIVSPLSSISVSIYNNKPNLLSCYLFYNSHKSTLTQCILIPRDSRYNLQAPNQIFITCDLLCTRFETCIYLSELTAAQEVRKMASIKSRVHTMRYGTDGIKAVAASKSRRGHSVRHRFVSGGTECHASNRSRRRSLIQAYIVYV